METLSEDERRELEELILLAKIEETNMLHESLKEEIHQMFDRQVIEILNQSDDINLTLENIDITLLAILKIVVEVMHKKYLAINEDTILIIFNTINSHITNPEHRLATFKILFNGELPLTLNYLQTDPILDGYRDGVRQNRLLGRLGRLLDVSFLEKIMNVQSSSESITPVSSSPFYRLHDLSTSLIHPVSESVIKNMRKAPIYHIDITQKQKKQPYKIVIKEKNEKNEKDKKDEKKSGGKKTRKRVRCTRKHFRNTQKRLVGGFKNSKTKSKKYSKKWQKKIATEQYKNYMKSYSRSRYA
uniref:Uncharacterized protein n=1 Tax=viral metagenome TaxID=1070528 RepID=A0A6C0HYZ8_9ZZZZ